MKASCGFIFLFTSLSVNSQTYHFNKLTSFVYGGGYDSKGSSFNVIVTDSIITVKTSRKESLHYIGDRMDKVFTIKKKENTVIEAIDKETSFIYFIKIREKSIEIKRTVEWPEDPEEYYFSN